MSSSDEEAKFRALRDFNPDEPRDSTGKWSGTYEDATKLTVAASHAASAAAHLKAAEAYDHLQQTDKRPSMDRVHGLMRSYHLGRYREDKKTALGKSASGPRRVETFEQWPPQDGLLRL